MRIVVTADGTDLESPASPIFGRCPTYIFVDTETMEFEAVENPSIGAPGGAGIKAAQFIVERGAQAVVTGNMGPNAFNVLQSANVSVHLFAGGTVRQAVEAHVDGKLSVAGGASAQAHAGTLAGKSYRIAAEKEEARQLTTATHPEKMLMSHDSVRLEKRKRFFEGVCASALPGTTGRTCGSLQPPALRAASSPHL